MRRREILKTLTILPFAGTFSGVASPVSSMPVPLADRDLFAELGLRTFINAAGNYTAMTGSLMPDEVLAVINSSSKKFVKLDELQDKVGEKIAALCHAEAPPTDNNMPTLFISWDPEIIRSTHTGMGEKLRSGNPSVEVISWEKENSIRVAMHCLQPGEEKVVARRLKEEFINSSK